MDNRTHHTLFTISYISSVCSTRRLLPLERCVRWSGHITHFGLFFLYARSLSFNFIIFQHAYWLDRAWSHWHLCVLRSCWECCFFFLQPFFFTHTLMLFKNSFFFHAITLISLQGIPNLWNILILIFVRGCMKLSTFFCEIGKLYWLKTC